MAEPRPDAGLERALAALAAELDWPPAPPLASAVTARLSAERARRARPVLPGLALWPRRRVLALAAAGVLALLALAAVARLAIGAIEIRVVPAPTSPPPPPPASGAELPGRPVTLDQARAALAFEPLVPDRAGAPNEAYLFTGPFGDEAVILAWLPSKAHPVVPGTSWGLLLMEFPGDEGFVAKTVHEVGAVTETAVAGATAYWIDRPHELALETSEGLRRYSIRGNVLIWTAGNLALRLETTLPLGDAIAIAESIG